MEPYRGANAVGNTGDDRRVPAGRLCALSLAGEYAGNIFWVVGFALIVSWIVAVVFTPTSASRRRPRSNRSKGGQSGDLRHAELSALALVIRFAVRHKFLICSIVGIAFALSVVGMGAVKQQFFPTSDRPEVLMEVRLLQGTSIERMIATVEKLERWLERQPEAKDRHELYRSGRSPFLFRDGAGTT